MSALKLTLKKAYIGLVSPGRKGRALDITDEYLKALGRLIDGLEGDAGTLQEIMGQAVYKDHLLRRKLQVAAVENGLLERELFQARAV